MGVRSHAFSKVIAGQGRLSHGKILSPEFTIISGILRYEPHTLEFS